MTMTYDSGNSLALTVKQAPASKNSSEVCRWAGWSAAEAKSIYAELHALGTQSKSHYAVTFTPLDTSLELANLPLFALGELIGGLLVTEANYPLLAIDIDSKKIGAFNVSQITGLQMQEITLTFLETKENHIIQSLKQWLELMINFDGTFNLPASFAAYLDITHFDREFGRNLIRSTTSFLVIPTLSNNDLSAKESSPIELQVTFSQVRQFE